MATTNLFGVNLVALATKGCVLANSLAPYATTLNQGGLKKGQY